MIEKTSHHCQLHWYLREEERERATHETNSSLSALSSPTDLGSGVVVCVHTGPAGETEVMWPEQHFFTYISVQYYLPTGHT